MQLLYRHEIGILESAEYKIKTKGSHQKKEKNFTTSVNYGGGGSKFWCVNLKKVLFLELIFLKKHAEINS